jgi:hypothetical protein
MLKLPVKVGDSWTKDVPTNQKQSLSYKVVRVEDVEVPAGNFKALRVEMTLTGHAFPIRTIVWYAPGVGIVKMERPSGGSVRTQMLKSVVSKRHEGG